MSDTELLTMAEQVLANNPDDAVWRRFTEALRDLLAPAKQAANEPRMT